MLFRSGEDENVEVIVDRENGDIKVFASKIIVNADDLLDPNKEISLEDAKKIKKRVKVGDTLKFEINSRLEKSSEGLERAEKNTMTKPSWLFGMGTPASSTRLMAFATVVRTDPSSWTDKNVASVKPSRDRAP